MKKLKLPLTLEERMQLCVGEEVLLSGVIYTARDAAHQKMMKEGYPISLKDVVIYYVGPTPSKKNGVIGSAGPTTSSRMDWCTPRLLDAGVVATIGKGKRSKEVKEAIIRNKALYFIAIGGAGALLSARIKEMECIAYPELDSEAIYRLYIEDFPVFVGIDTQGNDIYEEDENE